MIQSATISTIQKSLGFESLVGFGSQTGKEREGVRPKGASSDGSELTAEQQQEILRLKQIDLKVRAHEQAHISVGADLIRSGPTYSYTTGPDNKRYAVAGEVSIDTSPARTPEETIPKAQHIRATALAPAEPSPQDHSVAAQADRMEGRARQELSLQQREETAGAAVERFAGFYRDVEGQNGAAVQVGASLDLFA